MTQQHEHTFPYYRSPSSIRSEVFSHRVRGLDEAEVREYLSLLADQVEASELERAELRAENDRLRSQLERQQREQPADGEINPQAVLVLSQAQQVADQLVEEAVIHARDLMSSARMQQREIMEQAHRAAESASREVAQHTGHDLVAAAIAPPARYTRPIPEIEYVRTFARVAQVQLRSVLDALAEQVDKLGEVPELEDEAPPPSPAAELPRLIVERDWLNDPFPSQGPDGRGY